MVAEVAADACGVARGVFETAWVLLILLAPTTPAPTTLAAIQPAPDGLAVVGFAGI